MYGSILAPIGTKWLEVSGILADNLQETATRGNLTAKTHLDRELTISIASNLAFPLDFTLHLINNRIYVLVFDEV